MSDSVPKNSGEGCGLEVRGLVVSWNGRTYEINADKVFEAFEKAVIEDVMGPHSRYFLALGCEIKPMEAVFRMIVPIPKDDITPKLASFISEAMEALGFDVLDRHEHHEIHQIK